ncbi:MAG: zf-HC2 domain-containing protein [Acidobacteria bacterium]|nr:zf-HC2 domain-containing protein [Acidobacteriota bacterium]
MMREEHQIQCPVQGQDGAGLLLEYLDRRLDPPAAARIERHVSACPQCQQVVAAQRAVWEALDGWEPEPVSAGFDQRLFARLAAEGDRPAGWLARLAGFLGALAAPRPVFAAGAVCALMLGVLLIRQPGPDSPIAQVTEAGESPVVEVVEVESVEDTLADMDMLQQLGVAEPVEASGKQAI